MEKPKKRVSIDAVYKSHMEDMKNMGSEYYEEFEKFNAYVEANEPVSLKRKLYIITVIEKFGKAYVKNTKAEKILNKDYHQELRSLNRAENLDELYQMAVASDANNFMMMCLLFTVGSFAVLYFGNRYFDQNYLLGKTYDFLIIFAGLAITLLASDTKYHVTVRYDLGLMFMAIDIATSIICIVLAILTNVPLGILFLALLFELLVVTRIHKKKLDKIKDM